MSGEEGDNHDLTLDEGEVGGYKAPPEKSLNDILKADEEDEALERYKAALLPSKGTEVVTHPDNPHNVIINKLVLVVEGRPDQELDLTQDLKEIKKKTFVIKEGIQFRIRIDFQVQRDIVTGLKYVQKTTKKGITVDKMSHMVGSRPPQQEMQSFLTPMEDAPSGMIGRGSYHVYSLFTDDDKKEYLKWEWTIEFKKEWE